MTLQLIEAHECPAQSKHVNALVSENSSSVSTGCGEGALDGTLETVTTGVTTGGGLTCGT
jgi:hypothetical protein